MNKAILIGRLTRDPEVSIYNTKDGQGTSARFSLAVDRRGKDAGADFISCVAFGKTAEFVEKYFRKGMKMAAEGRIQTGTYTNKDGQKVYTTDVVVEAAEFCEKKGDDIERPAPQPQTDNGFMNIADNVEDEGLPFN